MLTRDEDLCQRDVVVRYKDHLQQVAHIRVAVHLAAHRIHHLDDLLGPLIPRSCLTTNHTRPRHHLHYSTVYDLLPPPDYQSNMQTDARHLVVAMRANGYQRSSFESYE